MKDEQRQSRTEAAKLRGEQRPPRRLSFLQASVAVMLTLAVMAAVAIPFLDESLLDMAELSARSFLGDIDAIATVEASAQASTGSPGLQGVAGPIYARPGATGTPRQESEAVAIASPTMELAPGAIQLPTATPAPEDEAAVTPVLENTPDATSVIGADSDAGSEEGVGATDADSASSWPLNIPDTILSADNVLVSQDTEVLGALLRDNDRAIGLMDDASVDDELRALSILLPDGSAAAPGLNSVSQGTYPLVHPLYLYTTGAVLQRNAAVTAFLGCYLVHVQDEWADFGFYPAASTDFDNALALYEVMTGYAEGQLLRSCLSANDVTASVQMRSTHNLVGLTRAIAEQGAADGFKGEVQIEPVTADDTALLCGQDAVELLVSDAPLAEGELQSCEQESIEPLEFIIGQSAAAVVVSANNTFVDRVTIEEAYVLLSSAERWSDVRETWPEAPITRAVVDPQSGTFATFVAAVAESDLAQQAESTSPTSGAAGEDGEPDLPLSATDPLTATASVTDTLRLTSAVDMTTTISLTDEITSTTEPAGSVGITTTSAITASPAITTVNAPTETPTETLTETLADTESETSSPAPTEAAEIPSGDLVLGLIDERETCVFAADIITAVLAERFDLDVATVSFATMEELYSPLLNRGAGDAADARGVDLTPCQMDPADRELLRVEGDAVSLIGSTYASNDGQRYLMVANADNATTLRREQSCIYEFLSKMDFGDLSSSRLDPTQWLALNDDLINEWALCDSEE